MRHVPASFDGTHQRTDTLPSSAGLHAAAQVADAVADLLAQGPELLEEIESSFGLRLGQLRALYAVQQGSSSAREVADATGEHPDAAAATLRTLAKADLIHPRGGAEDPGVQVTEAGRARLDQLAALSLRHVARLVDRSDPSHLAPVLTLPPPQTVTVRGEGPLPPDPPAA